MVESPGLKVAILNMNEDIVEALEHTFMDEGFSVASIFMNDVKRGRKDLIEFIRTHDPDAIVYDIPPPYRENVTVLKLLQHVDVMKGRPIVLTTTNVKLLHKECPEVSAYEIVGKPFDIRQIVQATAKAAKKKAA